MCVSKLNLCLWKKVYFCGFILVNKFFCEFLKGLCKDINEPFEALLLFLVISFSWFDDTPDIFKAFILLFISFSWLAAEFFNFSGKFDKMLKCGLSLFFGYKLKCWLLFAFGNILKNWLSNFFPLDGI